MMPERSATRWATSGGSCWAARGSGDHYDRGLSLDVTRSHRYGQGISGRARHQDQAGTATKAIHWWVSRVGQAG